MDYIKYKLSRDISFEILLKNNIKSLPVKISQICHNDGIKLRSYSQGADLIALYNLYSSVTENDGFAVILNDTPYILYNEMQTIQRIRFTVAHEYGHYVNGHISRSPTARNKEPKESDDYIETQANIVASRILAPACVLWRLKIHNAQEIASMCDISIASAEWRLKRLNLLYKREEEFINKYGKTCFLMSELERAVYENFFAVNTL